MTDPIRKPRPPRRAVVLGVLLALAGCNSGSSKSGGTTPTPAELTLHYHRPAADYAGWSLQITAGADETSATASGSDGFGAIYTAHVKSGASALAFTLANGGETDAAGPLTVDVSGTTREVWVISGWAEAIARRLPALPGPGQFAVYYLRADSSYGQWGLHVWGDQVKETAWGTPLTAAGVDPEFGAGFVIPRFAGVAGNCAPGNVCLIPHQGDTKDPGPDMTFSPGTLGNLVFLLTGSPDITAVPRKLGAVGIAGAAAHLLARDTLVWDVTDAAAASFELRYSATADVAATATDVVGGSTIALTPSAGGLSAALAAKAPYLQTRRVFTIAPADLPKVRDALSSQLVAVARKADGGVVKATKVQTAFALDDLYPYDGPLGVAFTGTTPTFRLWAPTAQSVALHVYDDAAGTEAAGSPVTPARDPATGVWSWAAPDGGWYGKYYRYELTVFHPLTGKVEHVAVTDPWAVNLSANGAYAQVVDLADPALAPPGWDALAKPALAAPEDIVVYESHVRDFSALDPTAPADRRGKYLGFVTEAGATPSDGLAHLRELAAAGLTHVHLLPVFDLATIDEDPANRVDVTQQFADLCAKNPAVPTATCGQFAGKTVLEALRSYPGDSDQQQAIAGWLKGLDSYNWGYDPLHYGAPEGSYASTADGTAKILEFRRMVQGLAAAGLRVVMDVVYNHTNAAGVADKSVLDKVVPGYYHRLDPDTGFVLTSSCCSNTATEHHMMERLMVDTLVRWARDYKVDGFRFDLMGLHLKSNLLAVQSALAAVDPSIYVYGEGWTMTEMSGNLRGLPAVQENMGGTGIGTFNDRIRDAVRGGGPFDNGAPPNVDLRRRQGFATGLSTDPNELNLTTAATTDRTTLLTTTDWLKLGMAGNLADFVLVKADGSTGKGSSVGYNGARAAYAQDPQETVNYVSAHDNEILWDIVQAKLPTGTSTAERVRMDLLATDTVLLGQGVPFVPMADDLLRSKSMDKNSYDSGDWFNAIDWSQGGNGWKRGLPPQGDNATNKTVDLALFGNASIAPGAADVAFAAAHFRDVLRIRSGSPLFRLRTKADVLARVDFLNGGPDQVPGVVVMTISDGACAGADVDPARDGVVVVVNADKVAHTFTVPGATGARLHPVLAASTDAIVKTAAVSGADLTVPARTTAVFELPQSGAQGAGLPCNTRVPN